MENNVNTENISNTENVDVKKEKKPLVIPKQAKILMVAAGALLIGAIVFAAIYIPRAKEEARLRKEYEEMINVEPNYDKMLSDLDKDSIALYKELLIGKYIARTSDTETKGRIVFDFHRNGNFYGHSSRNEDDAGSWSLESDDGNVAVVISVPDLMERYEVGFNNNNDITLKAVDGTVMVLEAEEDVLGANNEKPAEKQGN